MECESCQNQLFIFNALDGNVQCELCDPCKTCSADCGGRGFIFETSADGYRFAKDCPCTKMTKRAELMSRARLPSRYAQAEFGRIYVEDGESDIKTARSLSFRFTHEFEAGDPGLLFYGPTGTGKTLLTCCILKSLVLKKGISCRFIEFGHLLNELKNAFERPNGVGQVIQPLIDVTVLAVDELGKGRGTEWELSVLDELISKRYNAGRTTLFTSNYFPSEDAQFQGDEILSERLGFRIYSRLAEMCHPVRLTGTDYRRNQVVENRW